MTSTITDPVATGIQTVLATVTGLKAYKWPPKALDSTPAVVLELPAITRIEPDTPESQISTEDWAFEFPVVFYFNMSDPDFTHGQAAEIVEAAITAIDNNQTLGVNTSVVVVQDAKLVRAEIPEHIEEDLTIRWMTAINVFALVTT